MRRYVLGPVIVCFLVLGLVGADYGQVAQAQPGAKKETKSLTSKEMKSSHKNQGNTELVATTKKLTSPKKKIKVKHLSSESSKHRRKAEHLSKGAHKHQKKADHVSAADSKHRKKSDHVSAANHKHGRKSDHAKRLKKAKAQHRHARHAHPARPVSHIRPVEEYQFSSPQPSDLRLAKDRPDTYKELLSLEQQPDDLTFKVLSSAYSCIGIPYRHGGTTPDGFDCSGFIRYVFRENGIRLGRSSRDQAQDGRPVLFSELKPGDLIFFSMHPRRRNSFHIDHVGLYVGNGRFIHASGNRRAPEIRVEGLESNDYLPKIVEIRRILDEEQRLSSDLSY